MDPKLKQNRENAIAELDLGQAGVPRHIAIIMDGNGRWATERGLMRFEGHRQGGKTVETIVLHGVARGLECMTLYSFSMQNWRRPQDEIDYLMHLYSRYLVEIRPLLEEHNVRLVHLGRRVPLPQQVLDDMDETIRLTSNNTGMVLGLALNYGSRTEIADACQQIAKQCVAGELNPDEIDPDMIADHLNTVGLPDPDLVIRTSGEMRISNFLLWQLSYAEFYVTQTHWPDFSPEDFDQALVAFASRSRRFGDVKAKVEQAQAEESC